MSAPQKTMSAPVAAEALHLCAVVGACAALGNGHHSSVAQHHIQAVPALKPQRARIEALCIQGIPRYHWI